MTKPLFGKSFQIFFSGTGFFHLVLEGSKEAFFLCLIASVKLKKQVFLNLKV